MQWTIPGTVLAAQTEDAEKIRDVFNAFFLAGNISLSQVSAISGLEPYMIQNWVRRKYLSNSQGKKYSLDQLCRILTINLLRKSMSIDKVCDLLSYVNGQLDESGDDLIADAELYFLLVSLAAQVYGRKGSLEEGIEKSVRQLPERIPGANQKIQKALSIMLYAWCAAFLRDRADALMENLEKEELQWKKTEPTAGPRRKKRRSPTGKK